MPGAIFNTKAMGEALRAERAALGMTQAKLAAAAGVPRQRISEIERGENVTALLLLRVLAAMGKGLRIVDVRPTAGDLRSLFEEDQDAP